MQARHILKAWNLWGCSVQYLLDSYLIIPVLVILALIAGYLLGYSTENMRWKQAIKEGKLKWVRKTNENVV